MKKKKTLRVLSYNIHKGFTATNLDFILARIRESIRVVHADVVFLQEVLGHHENSRRRIRDWPTTAQFEYLADEIWPHHVYGKNAVYTSGHHGNAILSKYPVSSWENIDVSTNQLERRGLLHAVLEHPSGPIHAICVHLGLFETARRQQIQSLSKRIEGIVPHDAPLVIAGDFNDWWQRATASLQKRLEVREAYFTLHGEHAKTFPSWMPVLRLDRIYVRNLVPIEAKSLTGEPWDALSDHVAVFAELEL